MMRRVLLIAAFLTATATLWAGYVIMPGPADGQLTDIGNGYFRWEAGGAAPAWTDPYQAYWMYAYIGTSTTNLWDMSTNRLDATNMPSVASGPVATAVTNINGRVNYVYYYDGSEDYHNCGIWNTNTWDGTNATSLSFWAKSVTPGYCMVSFGTVGGAEANSFGVFHNIVSATDIYMHWNTAGGAAQYTATGAFPFGQWTHIGISWDRGMLVNNTNIIISVNGVNKARTVNTTLLINICGSVCNIGRQIPGTYYFKGTLANVIIYRFPLSIEKGLTLAELIAVGSNTVPDVTITNGYNSTQGNILVYPDRP